MVIINKRININPYCEKCLIYDHHHSLILNKWFLFVFVIQAFFVTGCEETDIGMALQAGTEAYKAVTLNDKDVEGLAVEISKRSDLNNTVALPENSHVKRLKKLVGSNYRIQGHEFNLKVYLSPNVNAFAMADGTIRIYSALMDMLDDDELMFVIGHEMGHVVKKHIKKKIMLAYAGSAVRKAIASQKNEVGEIARSGFGSFVENLLNAQFSQKEEREADDFGVLFLKQEGRNTEPAISALIKLTALGNKHSFLSSHPAPEARAKRLRENASSSPQNIEELSLFKRVIDWLKNFIKQIGAFFPD